MKKLSGMIALGMTLAMMLGTTAFADESNGTDFESSTPGVVVSTTVQQDVKTTALEKAGTLLTVPDGMEVQEVASFDLDGVVPADGVVEVRNVGVKADGTTYKALHLLKDGTWKVHDVEVVSDGVIRIKGIDQYSPFILVTYVEEVGEEESSDEGSSANQSAAAPAAAQAPKTGETVPATVVIALTAMAGAVLVGSKKVGMER